MTALFLVLGLANLMILACVVFLYRFFAAVDMVRWEQNPAPPPRGGRRRREPGPRGPKLETSRRR